MKNLKPRDEDKLKSLLNNFPNRCYFSISEYAMRDLPHYLALILYYAGIESVRHTTGKCAGRGDLEHLMLETNSLIVHPYITVDEKSITYSSNRTILPNFQKPLKLIYNSKNLSGIPLLWFLFKKLNISYCGAANCDEGNKKGYTQLCMVGEFSRPGYYKRDSQEKEIFVGYYGDSFVQDIVSYFNAFLHHK